MTRALHVLATGPQVLVQDLGRPGYAHLGVCRSGAADRSAHELAARLLAQEPDRAGLEVLLGGLTVRAEGDLTVCLTGAPTAATLDERPVAHHAPLTLRDGQVLALGPPLPADPEGFPAGLRTYLAVRGGLDVEPVLGSRSFDTLAELGPPPVREGDVLPVGAPPPDLPHVDHAPPAPVDPGAPLVLRCTPGPRADWLDGGAAALAGPTTWTVGDRTDRVGTRLEGAELGRAAAYQDAELPSEPMVRGAVQVPPDGRPVIFGVDHPVTGGYPVVAVVLDADVDRLAQAAPGRRVRLRLGDEDLPTPYLPHTWP